MGIEIKFWGVRGSIPCPSLKYMAFGGNTSCVEINLDGKVIIIDAGSGIRELGKDLIRRQTSNAALLISHTHWDHINGFPFFIPVYQENSVLDVYAAVMENGRSSKEVFELQMSSPFFPMPMHTLQSSLRFHDFQSGDSFSLYDNTVQVTTAPLNHPNGAAGFRIDYNGRSIAYISDTEHNPKEDDKNTTSLMNGCDFVIYDALYTDEEFPEHIGWGHSTWQEAVRLAKQENVAQLALFHHSPEHDDEIMEAIEKQAQAVWPHVFAARENTVISLK